MGSVRECFPPLEGNRRRRPLDEYDTGVVPHVGGGDTLSDLHTKLAHIQWRKHANNKSIRYEQRCWMSTIDFCIFCVDYCGSCAKRIDDVHKLITLNRRRGGLEASSYIHETLRYEVHAVRGKAQ